ncbi:MAG: hypothetical protein FJ265_19225, partial [Planctomycetes bacterium]|nr:hypothetical protein [Planctomycetota bacterium]
MRIHTFLLPALLAPAVLAQRVPEVEPNNTVAQAQVINPGTPNANLVAAESDWYAFTITGGELRVCTNGTVDMRIRLYDATGTVPLAVNDDCRASLNSDLRINLQPGSYTLLVDGSSTSATGAYSLDVGLEGPFKPYTANELEPNENVAQAQLIVAGDQIRASLGPPVPVLSDLVPAPIIVLSDVVAASTTTVITATVPLTAGAYVPGFAVQMTSGTNIGLVRAISANTATTITTAAWPVANAPGDTYDVITANTT